MSYEVKIVLDSVGPSGKRLTTMTWRYPRFIHSEIMTHRMLSKNSASSRAIPSDRILEMIQGNPVMPIRWGSEQKGMQTGSEIENPTEADLVWLGARRNAVKSAIELQNLGVHKSLVNRLLEPWMWITIVISGTEWENLWRLRCHEDAEIHFQKIVGMARNEMDSSKPQQLKSGEWHLPFIDFFDLRENQDIQVLKKASVARCGRVSYLTHEGKRDIEKDLQLFDRLCQGSGFGHWSPHEHVASAMETKEQSGNFFGWAQYRKEFHNEVAMEK